MKTIDVTLYTIPQAACGSNKMSWADVFTLLQGNLEKSFPDAHFKHIEFMSPEWFNDVPAQKYLETGSINFPFVLVNGEVACADAKVNISKIRKFIENIKDQS